MPGMQVLRSKHFWCVECRAGSLLGKTKFREVGDRVLGKTNFREIGDRVQLGM